MNILEAEQMDTFIKVEVMEDDEKDIKKENEEIESGSSTMENDLPFSDSRSVKEEEMVVCLSPNEYNMAVKKEEDVNDSDSLNVKTEWEAMEFFQEHGIIQNETFCKNDPMSEGPTSTHKRMKYPKKWKGREAKKKRNSGEAYISTTTKLQVPARGIGAPCSCTNKCFMKIGMANIQEIFTNFWSLADYNAQNSYLHSRVNIHDIKRRKVNPAGSRRQQSRTYTVMAQNTIITVCLIALCRIHAISEKRVRIAIIKGTTTGNVTEDKRGRHKPKNKTPADVIDAIREHITAIPTCTSHYSRDKSSERVYLPPGSSKSSLYNDYKTWLTDEKKRPDLIASFYIYDDTFNTQFNIGVEPPRSDTCNYCDEKKIELKRLEDAGDPSAVHLKAQLQFHIASSTAAHGIMGVYRDNKDPTLAAISMDLQQTLPTPRIRIGVQYYKRKLWTYNFGVHNLKNGNAYFYVWHEGEGKRGSVEVASCLNHYVENYVGDEVRKLVIFSDNCGAQNKNINVVLFYLRLVHSGRFDHIQHYFMVPGHSFLPIDIYFGNLERFVSPRNVFSTQHYVSLIKICKTTRPFIVIEMTRANFLNFDAQQALITKTGFSGSGFKDGKIFIVDKMYKMGFQVKAAYDELHDPEKIKLQKGRSLTYNPDAFYLPGVPLIPKYPNGVLLKPDKLRDIKLLARFVEAQYMAFYDNLLRDQEAGRQGAGGRGDPEESDSGYPDDFLDY